MIEEDAPLDYQELVNQDATLAKARYGGYTGSASAGGGRYGSEYPQYLISAIEKEAKQHYNTARGMQTLTGPAVSQHITDYYVNKGFPIERAQHISSVVEGKIHHSHTQAAMQQAKRLTRRQNRPRTHRVGGMIEEVLATG